MADNKTFQSSTLATLPADTVVASDEISGVDWPYGKVAFGADGTATIVTATVGLPVGDAGGSLTVDAPVGTPVFVRLSDGSSAISTLPVSLASVPSHAVTNAGTFAVQAAQSGTWSTRMQDGSGNALTSQASGALRGLHVVLTDDDGHLLHPVATNDIVATDYHGLILMGADDGSPITHYQPMALTTSGHVKINDGSGSLTVDAPVGTPVFVRLSDGSSAITTLPVSLTSVPSHAVTNAGTFAVQVDGAALTSLQLIDDIVYVDDGAWTNDTSKHALVGGIYQSTPQTVTDGKTAPIQLTANGYQIVSVNGTVTVGSHAVTNAGTFAVQESGTALTRLTDIETNTDSGAVVGNGAAATAQRVTLANDSTGIIATVGAVTSITNAVTVAQVTAANLNCTEASASAIKTAVEVIDNFISGSRGLVTEDNSAAIAASLSVMDDWDDGSDRARVVGPVAEDGTLAGNVLACGGRASYAEPTAMSADGDVVFGWHDRRGRVVTKQQCGTGTQTSVSGSASNVTLLAANTSRLGAIIYNDSSATLYVRYQATATTSNFSVKLFPDDYCEPPAGYTGIIDGIWSSATGSARVTEFT